MSERVNTDTALALTNRLEQLRDSAPFRVYEDVRRQVLALKERERRSPTDDPSAYWSEELQNFEYLLDASPLIVSKLRHHTYHVTGLRVYDYRTHKDEAKRRLAEKLNALVEAAGGDDLLVPEPPVLGGFGFEIDGRLYNVDTLKFFEAMIALERGEVLAPFRDPNRRRSVVEIGSGWGGFAYQFKTLFPNTTIVLVDFPELFLFSATYLKSLFPDARASFLAADAELDLTGDDAPDFLFVPHTDYSKLPPFPLDLTVNMVSFQEMTSEQVESYVRETYERDCRFLYSLNRDRSFYNPELTSVRSIMSRFYWLHEIPVLPVSYAKMLHHGAAEGAIARARQKAGKAKRRLEGSTDLEYKHVVGWRRVSVDE